MIKIDTPRYPAPITLRRRAPDIALPTGLFSPFDTMEQQYDTAKAKVGG